MHLLRHPVSVTTQFIGLTAYEQALQMMEQAIAHSKGDTAYIWGLEHPLVYTSGLKTDASHILSEAVQVVPARRGGSVTLHNPGQLVIYFVLPLAAVNGGLERFVRVLEAVMAEALLSFGIAVNLLPGASGVFTPAGKIAFIGLGLKKGCIYHGASINVANNLADFRAIQSCGLTLSMTSMQAQLSERTPSIADVFTRFSGLLLERFKVISPAEFRSVTESRLDFRDWFTGFRLGWLAFHERRYWEAHELWELYWHEMPPGDLRIFFHALIQTAMAFYKIFTVPNLAGAESLLAKALEKYAVTKGIRLLQEQEKFLEFLAGVLGALQNKKPVEDLLPPVMSWVAEQPGLMQD
ncbi:MAG TPA: lipoyl(octanoyl) transferase LipB [Turneriella sp.]|nr:lipoyl(octanoyl) transferase LipB [Turneriella sp.]